MKKYLYLFTLNFIALTFFVSCEEKAKPKVTINSDLLLPVSCMKLNIFGSDKELVDSLKKLYAFDDACTLTLTLSSKKDIVCNSTNNMMSKNMGKFPKSFIKIELREGMKLQYSYYVDLFSNVDEDDVEEGFERLKKDLLMPKGAE
jgi:hypothetical protein